MKKLSAALDSVENAISTLVPVTFFDKGKVPKMLIQRSPFGTNKKQSNCAIVGSSNDKSSTKGLNNTAKCKGRQNPECRRHGLLRQWGFAAFPSMRNQQWIRYAEMKSPYWGTNEEDANEMGSYLDHEEKVWDRSLGHRRNTQNSQRANVNCENQIRELWEPLDDSNLDQRVWDIVQRTIGEANNHRECIGYKKPYREWIDQTYEFLRGFRFPDFTKFSGDDHQLTERHLSITRLSLNLIEEWDRMEDAFHQQFYHCVPEVRFTDLAQIVQRARETASQYVERFKTARMRCNAKIL
ncbi:hypothetical protein ACH5RR_023451 [Cinchona calisaya]|uniref:Retrotransposon gag domain-containing protein n=1 Tax=Cinchona calisaya TaxID=153742 RepID=A0ABD2ZC84_9GENT